MKERNAAKTAKEPQCATTTVRWRKERHSSQEEEGRSSRGGHTHPHHTHRWGMIGGKLGKSLGPTSCPAYNGANGMTALSSTLVAWWWKKEMSFWRCSARGHWGKAMPWSNGGKWKKFSQGKRPGVGVHQAAFCCARSLAICNFNFLCAPAGQPRATRNEPI